MTIRTFVRAWLRPRNGRLSVLALAALGGLLEGVVPGCSAPSFTPSGLHQCGSDGLPEPCGTNTAEPTTPADPAESIDLASAMCAKLQRCFPDPFAASYASLADCEGRFQSGTCVAGSDNAAAQCLDAIAAEPCAACVPYPPWTTSYSPAPLPPSCLDACNGGYYAYDFGSLNAGDAACSPGDYGPAACSPVASAVTACENSTVECSPCPGPNPQVTACCTGDGRCGCVTADSAGLCMAQCGTNGLTEADGGVDGGDAASGIDGTDAAYDAMMGDIDAGADATGDP